MKNPSRFLPQGTRQGLALKRLSLAIVSLLATGLSTLPAHAATRTWSGNGLGNYWSADQYLFGNRMNNWSQEDVPVSGDMLVFAGSRNSSNRNDLVNLNIAGLSFAVGSTAFTLSGNALALTGSIINLSNQLQTLELPITLAATSTWDGGTAGLLMSGALNTANRGLTLKNKVEVSNADTDWTVGQGAAQSFNVLSGSRLSSLTGYIGRDAAGFGDVSVADSGSSWQNAGNLYVGSSGRGNLQVSGGAQVSNAQGYLAYFSGSQGTATVTGAGSRWTHAQDLKVGVTGIGRLDIEAGGEVLNQTGYLGYVAGSNGVVHVTGAGSRWANSGGLTVGLAGNGVLSVGTGGRVEAGAALVIGSGGSVSLDGGTLQAASASRSGAGQFAWNSGSLVLGSASLGDSSGVLASTLSLSSGRVLEVLNLQMNTGTQVNVLAEGVIGARTGLAMNGGVFNINNHAVTLAALSGTGTVHLGGVGDDVAPGQLQVGSAQNSSFAGTLAGNGYFTKVGAGTLSLGGSFNLASETVAAGELRHNGGAAVQLQGLFVGVSGPAAGTLSLDNATLSTTLAAVGYSGSGVLDIRNGAQLNSQTGQLSAQAGGLGTATVQGNGRWSTASLAIGKAGLGGTLNLLSGGTVAVSGAAQVGSVGVLNLAGGAFSTQQLVLSPGAEFNWSAGTLKVTGAGGVNLGHDGVFEALTVLGNGKTLVVSQTLALDAQAMLVLQGSGRIQAGQLALSDGLLRANSLNMSDIGLLSGYGVVSAAIVGGTAANTIRASQGTLVLGNANAANGFDFGGVLDVGSQRVVLLDQDQAQLGSTTLLAVGGRLEAGMGLTLGTGQVLSFAGPASVLGDFQNQGLVATWNVNSLSVRLPQLLDWLAANPVDVLVLQETKLTDDKFPHADLEAAGYHAQWFGQKTYNGVALLSRSPSTDIVKNIPGFADEQARVIAGTVNDPVVGSVRVIGCYFPNGQAPDSDKFVYKMNWLTALQAWVQDELTRHPNLV
jgi:autotransporter family porin